MGWVIATVPDEIELIEIGPYHWGPHFLYGDPIDIDNQARQDWFLESLGPPQSGTAQQWGGLTPAQIWIGFYSLPLATFVIEQFIRWLITI